MQNIIAYIAVYIHMCIKKSSKTIQFQQLCRTVNGKMYAENMVASPSSRESLWRRIKTVACRRQNVCKRIIDRRPSQGSVRDVPSIVAGECPRRRDLLGPHEMLQTIPPDDRWFLCEHSVTMIDCSHTTSRTSPRDVRRFLYEHSVATIDYSYAVLQTFPPDVPIIVSL